MEVTYNSGKLTATFDSDTPKDLFSQISSFQEVFGQCECGKCKSEDIRYVVRNVDDNDYYEMRCQSCAARLSFGLNKKGGGMFPKRKDKDGNWLPDGGWVKWNPNTKKAE
jgi:hypothetical protein